MCASQPGYSHRPARPGPDRPPSRGDNPEVGGTSPAARRRDPDRPPSRGDNPEVARLSAARGNVDRVIADIARDQRGVVSARQLDRCGIGRRAIDHRLARGRLHRVFRGVYLVGHPVAPEWAVETAALLIAPKGSVVSHHTAAAVWDLAPRSRVVHITVTAGRPDPRPGLAIHTSRTLEEDCTTSLGLHTTSPARTLVDLAGALGRDGLADAYERAQILRLADHDSVAAAIARAGGRRGARTLRAVIAEQPTTTRSRAERRLLRALAAAGLPRPETNVTIHGHEVDLLWRRAGLVVEMDGFATHRTRAAFERDRWRDAELQAAGLRVVRTTWRQLAERPDRVVQLLAATRAHGLTALERREPGSRSGGPGA